MTRHIDDTRLNDYLEGLVTEDVARAVEVHLAACEGCSGRLEALTLLLSELAGLPDDATPARDLWHGVRAEIAPGLGHGEGEIQDTVTDEGGAIPIWRGRPAGTRFTGPRYHVKSSPWRFGADADIAIGGDVDTVVGCAVLYLERQRTGKRPARDRVR